MHLLFSLHSSSIHEPTFCYPFINQATHAFSYFCLSLSSPWRALNLIASLLIKQAASHASSSPPWSSQPDSLSSCCLSHLTMVAPLLHSCTRLFAQTFKSPKAPLACPRRLPPPPPPLHCKSIQLLQTLAHQDAVTQNPELCIALVRDRLEKHLYKRAYTDAECRSTWIDRVVEKVQFLVEQGIPPAEIEKILEKPATAMRFGSLSVTQLDAFIQYFLSLHFEHVSIGILLRKGSAIWYLDIEKDVKPVVEYLQNIKIVGQNLEKIIVKDPNLLLANLQTLQSLVELLKSVSLDENGVFKVLYGCHRLWRTNVERILKPRVDTLRSQGFFNDPLRKVLFARPYIFQISFDENTMKKMNLLEELGISRESPRFAAACELLLYRTCDVLRSRFAFLVSLGFSHDDVRIIVQRCPLVLGLKEQTTSQKVAYVTNVMGRSAQEIVRWPDYLVLNLERRIKPRYEAFVRLKMQDDGKYHSLCTIFGVTDANFFKKSLLQPMNQGTRIADSL